MGTPDTIRLGEVKEYADRVFDVLRRAGVAELPVTFASYWKTEIEDMYSVEEPKPAMGDLVADLSDLRWYNELVDEGFDLTACCRKLAILFNVMALAEQNGQFTPNRAERARRHGGR
jgi:hypothetical protein